MKKIIPLVALALALAVAPMTSFAQTTGGGTGNGTATTVNNGGASRATSVGLSLWTEVQKFSQAGLELSINLRNNRSGQLVTGIKGKTLEMIPFWGVAGIDYTIEIEILPQAAGLRFDRNGRPLMKVRATGDDSTDQRITLSKPDEKGRVVVKINLAKFTGAEMINFGCRVDMATGRDYSKTLCITWSARDHYEGAMARITIPVKGVWPKDIPLNDDSVADYQVLAAAETVTNVPQNIGGIIRYANSQALTDALRRLHNPQPVQQDPPVVTTQTVTVTVDQKGRIVESDSAKCPFVVSTKDGDLIIKAFNPSEVTVYWKLQDGYNVNGAKAGKNLIGADPLVMMKEALASVDIEWKDLDGKVHVYIVNLASAN